jgi:hypothetical protein
MREIEEQGREKFFHNKETEEITPETIKKSINKLRSICMLRAGFANIFYSSGALNVLDSTETPQTIANQQRYCMAMHDYDANEIIQISITVTGAPK